MHKKIGHISGRVFRSPETPLSKPLEKKGPQIRYHLRISPGRRNAAHSESPDAAFGGILFHPAHLAVGHIAGYRNSDIVTSVHISLGVGDFFQGDFTQIATPPSFFNIFP